MKPIKVSRNPLDAGRRDTSPPDAPDIAAITEEVTRMRDGNDGAYGVDTKIEPEAPPSRDRAIAGISDMELPIDRATHEPDRRTGLMKPDAAPPDPSPPDSAPPLNPERFERGEQLTFAGRLRGGERWFGSWRPHDFDDAS
jgi:hypothetical protein